MYLIKECHLKFYLKRVFFFITLLNILVTSFTFYVLISYIKRTFLVTKPRYWLPQAINMLPRHQLMSRNHKTLKLSEYSNKSSLKEHVNEEIALAQTNIGTHTLLIRTRCLSSSTNSNSKVLTLVSVE